MMSDKFPQDSHPKTAKTLESLTIDTLRTLHYSGLSTGLESMSVSDIQVPIILNPMRGPDLHLWIHRCYLLIYGGLVQNLCIWYQAPKFTVHLLV